ncbi:hypothetical protein FGB62_331g02 [Gracilaria domingensis]|nr:hypothetical protein FGB62_331g02 [Gracilaria domingensis]
MPRGTAGFPKLNDVTRNEVRRSPHSKVYRHDDERSVAAAAARRSPPPLCAVRGRRPQPRQRGPGVPRLVSRQHRAMRPSRRHATRSRIPIPKPHSCHTHIRRLPAHRPECRRAQNAARPSQSSEKHVHRPILAQYASRAVCVVVGSTGPAVSVCFVACARFHPRVPMAWDSWSHAVIRRIHVDVAHHGGA